jgi:ABC-type multidrug transport system permease subunit
MKGCAMKFIDIALKDLYQIFKDWEPVIFLVIAPIIFTIMFGFMFGGFSGPGDEVTDNRLPVQLIDQEETNLSKSITTYLENSDILRVEKSTTTNDLSKYKQAVADQTIAAAILIPDSFQKIVMGSGDIPLEVILDENTTAGISVLQEIQSAISRLQTAAQTADLALQIYEEKTGIEDENERTAFYSKTFNQTLNAWKSPLVTATVTQTAPDGAQSTSEDNAFAHSLPGMIAQFAIAGLISAAEIIVQERRSGALSRLLGTAVSKSDILLGHWLAMFSMIFLQFAILITFGQIFLRLNFFNAPFATFLLAVASCSVIASLGLLIGILAKLPEQTIVFSLIPMFIFSGLGGAWVPMELLGETVRRVSRFTPVAWIMTGYKDILLRGAHLNDVTLPILVLFGFSALFLIPAVILFYSRKNS